MWIWADAGARGRGWLQDPSSRHLTGGSAGAGGRAGRGCFRTSSLLQIPQLKKNGEGMRHVSGSRLLGGVECLRGRRPSQQRGAISERLYLCVSPSFDGGGGVVLCIN